MFARLHWLERNLDNPWFNESPLGENACFAYLSRFTFLWTMLMSFYISVCCPPKMLQIQSHSYINFSSFSFWWRGMWRWRLFASRGKVGRGCAIPKRHKGDESNVYKWWLMFDFIISWLRYEMYSQVHLWPACLFLKCSVDSCEMNLRWLIPLFV